MSEEKREDKLFKNELYSHHTVLIHVLISTAKSRFVIFFMFYSFNFFCFGKTTKEIFFLFKSGIELYSNGMQHEFDMRIFRPIKLHTESKI